MQEAKSLGLKEAELICDACIKKTESTKNGWSWLPTWCLCD
jgi:hypothetical protein